MKNALRFGLLVGAAIIVGATVALAQLGEPRQPLLPGEQSQSRGRFADRFLAEFDLNHDGKVPRDEFNKAVAKEFYAASHGAQTMTEDQYIASRTKDLHQRVTELFHRSDWNGDGKLSFDEYAAPERARFEQLDKDATGVVFCSARRSEASGPERGKGYSTNDSGRSSRGRSAGGARGRSGFCAEADIDRDGKVTRPELDTALKQQFQAVTKVNAFMTPDELYGLELGRYRELDARIFQRMNTSYTGRLTLQEYAASETKFFARLDKNGNGVIEQNELSSRRKNNATNNHFAKSGR